MPFIVGQVCTFAMLTPPPGFLKCNGQLVSRTTYAALFATIGTVYGAGDGSTTFAVPETRGEFLRCLDDGRSVDSGRYIGSAQDGTWVRTVTQEWAGSDTVGGPFAIGFGYANPDAEISSVSVNGTVPSGAKSPGGTSYLPATTDNVMTGNSTVDTVSAVNHWIKGRPRNVAFLACIFTGVQ